MPHVISKGENPGKERMERLGNHIVLNDVVIKEREMLVDIPVPKYREVEYEKPVIKEVETTKYNKVTKDTIKYIPQEVKTIKYNPIVTTVEKPIIVDKIYEKPVVKEVQYEKPVMIEKEYYFISEETIKRLERFTECLDKLCVKLPQLERQLEGRGDFKLIEEVVHFLHNNGIPEKE